MFTSRLPPWASEVRRLDNDRFLCALFAPAERRSALLTLYAFNLEVARIRECISEPLLGQIRLQWWRDSIDGLYLRPAAKAAGAPVLAALAGAIAAHRLDKAHFERLLAGREADMAADPPADLATLIDYVDATSASLVLLALQVLGADVPAAREAGRHVGIAWGLTGLLRAVPFHVQAGRLYLPADLLKRAGVAAEAVFDRSASREGIVGVVADLAAVACDHLATARRTVAAVPPAAVPALLPAALADGYLSQLRRVGHDPWRADRRGSGMGRHLRLLAAGLCGRY